MAKKTAPNRACRTGDYDDYSINFIQNDMNDMAETMSDGISVSSLNIQRKFKLLGRHQEMYNVIMDTHTRMVIAEGPAGTAKTYIAVLTALDMLKNKEVDRVVYVRSLVESSEKDFGTLPGGIDEKFGPWTMPLVEKMNEILTKDEITMLFTNNKVQCIPVNYVRGLTFRRTCVIIDEAQNMTFKELQTLLTRFGSRSKYIIVGDRRQSDINSSGFTRVMRKLNSRENKDVGIYCVQFDETDIRRSKIVRHIVAQLEKPDPPQRDDWNPG